MFASVHGRSVLAGDTVIDIASGQPKCHRFSGVPYALPPTGNRRFRKPEPLPVSYSYGSRDCPGSFESTACPQMSQFLRGQVSDEDCLRLNIWVPLGIPPVGGWPVLVYIHGGFLQYGSPNIDDPSSLISETDVKCIFVVPGYRLGVFGFLASEELWQHASDSVPAANFGFWDQRLAIEWTYDNIQCFGGNKYNITVGGLSAGSYSAFHQLAHDILKAKRQIIRRVLQWSNGCGVEPKRISEAQEQFDELIDALQIPYDWSGSQKVIALREKTADELLQAVGNMKHKFIRPVLDKHFIAEDLFFRIYDGSFGRRMEELGITTMIGDLTQEYHIYKRTFPPNSFEGLIDRLSWDYPLYIVQKVCAQYKPLPGTRPGNPEVYWMEVFGHIYADLQIHSTMRGLIETISPSVTVKGIYRYRIDWRTESVDKRFSPELGATHTSDMSIWFFGNGDYLLDSEKDLIREWLQPLGEFLRGEIVDWGTRSISQVRFLSSEGKIEIKEDEVMRRKLELWHLVEEVTEDHRTVRPRL